MTRLAEFYKLFPDSEGLLSNLFQGLFVLRFMVAFPQVGAVPDNAGSEVEYSNQKLTVTFFYDIDLFEYGHTEVVVVGGSWHSERLEAVFEMMKEVLKEVYELLKLWCFVGSFEALKDVVDLS